MIVFCGLDDCIFNVDGCCDESSIYLSDDGECESYSCYKDRPEYQTEYWIASAHGSKDGKMTCRMKRKGKRIEYGGLVFYTSSNDRDPRECYLTEARTGYGAGRLSALDAEKIEKYKELAAALPDVMTLPIRDEAETP